MVRLCAAPSPVYRSSSSKASFTRFNMGSLPPPMFSLDRTAARVLPPTSRISLLLGARSDATDLRRLAKYPARIAQRLLVLEAFARGHDHSTCCRSDATGHRVAAAPRSARAADASASHPLRAGSSNWCLTTSPMLTMPQSRPSCSTTARPDGCHFRFSGPRHALATGLRRLQALMATARPSRGPPWRAISAQRVGHPANVG